VDLTGTSGSDVLAGTAGADTIDALWGSDTVTAGNGDDLVTDDGGTDNAISAGAGNDRIIFADAAGFTTVYQAYLTNTLIDAGDGNDFVSFDSTRRGSAAISLGAGNDVLLLGQNSELFWSLDSVAITLGTGQDLVKFGFVIGDGLRSRIGAAPVVVSDFAAGAGGDALNIADLLRGFFTNPTPLTVFPAENPFASGHVLLIADGADTIVRIDYDGNGPGTGETYTRDIIRLVNVTASQLVAENFAGWAPNGTAPLAVTIGGTAGDDRLFAGAVDSTLDGLAGNDTLLGSGGDETLDGGTGSDMLDGGDGNDLLRGGDGDDVITDIRGNDTVLGGAGDDEITLIRPVIASVLPSATNAVVVDAGGGNDRVDYTVERFQGVGTQSVDATLTVDLGAGDDYFYLDNARGTTTLTLGSGRDRVELGALFKYLLPGKSPLIITDFLAGQSGDQIDLGLLLSRGTGWDMASNPFASGHLRLEQLGADTLILWDYDGVNGNDELETLVLLRNVSATSLTSSNFAGYDPHHAAVTTPPITGTTGADSHIGGAGNEAIEGLGGNDRLWGGFGKDMIDGGMGNDTIEGGFGDDVLTGGIGDDRITDTGEGSDSLSGGDGDDMIAVRHEYSFKPEIITISGGAGNDTLEFQVFEASGNAATLIADMGAGDDRVTFLSLPGGGATLTLGTGIDTVVLDQSLASQAKRSITITDFQTGNAGDVLDWVGYMELYSRQMPFLLVYPDDGSETYNPFETGQARLIQSGSDTLLQMSFGLNFVDYNTIVIFKNTDAASFTQHNLGIDFASDTAPSTPGNDIFAGTAGRDVVRGGEGNDRLTGLDGKDLLVGGAGSDTLDGGDGDDVLYGGAGADTIAGGAGNDVIDGGSGADRLDGGDGDDRLTIDWMDVAFGGAGHDRVYLQFAWYQDILDSGLPFGSLATGGGDDLVIVRDAASAMQAGGYSIDLGSGNDRIITDGAFGTLTLGSGTDRIEAVDGVDAFVLTVTDFQAGNGGDVFSFGTHVNSAFNPFAVGAASLVQDGNDVVLSYNGDLAFAIGLTSPLSVRFRGTTVGQFTAYNFDGYELGLLGTPAIHVENTLVIAAGTTRTVANPILEDNVAAAVIYASIDGKAQFVNHGTVLTTVTPPSPVGRTVGFRIDNFHPTSSQSLFHNAADGTFSVQSGAGSTYGYYAPSIGIAFRNDGRFEVGGVGLVVGVLGGYQPSSISPFLNTGTIVVSGGTDTYGFYLGGSGKLDNRGTITVNGPEFAVGVYMPGAGGQQFENSGTITVITAPASPFASIGILTEGAPQNPGQTNSFVNSGKISAEIAFYSLDVSPAGASETLINSGTIQGIVFMDAGADVVLNSGTMDARTLLGAGADLYDGRSGHHLGSVEGGEDNDTLIGGAGDDILFGDAQDDVIAAGAGNDYVEGGQGNDMLDGGAGDDMVSYYGSPLAILADLAAGTVVTSQDMDHVRGFEQVFGSRGNDTISGAAAGEVLAGYRGNDRIDGRAGNDVILGGAGNDTLNGGTGDDAFLFETGDGHDEITDFSDGDALEIYGYTAWQSIQQQGADVRITLSASDSILVRGANAATFMNGNLWFSGQTGVKTPDIRDETFFPTGNLVIDANTVFELIDTQPLHIRYSIIQSTAIALEAPLGVGGLGVWNAGTVRFSTTDAAPYSTGIASSIANGYGGRTHWFVNEAGGTLSVTAANAKAIGTYGIGAVWNFGTIAVISQSGDASAVLGVNPNTYGPVAGTFVNAGTITVDAAATGRGVDQSDNTGSVDLMVNSGQIVVHGGAASNGIENAMSAHPAVQQPRLVNSGTITVTDDTAAIDSAGLSLDISSKGVVWNSGTITADYAINVIRGTSYASWADYSLTVYNSGTLDGRLHLSGYGDVVVNTGTIDGDVNLAGGNDFYDGRQGQLRGSLDGYDGNDTLLAGAGNQDILGGFGDDVLSGGAGDDTLSGGAGVDSFRFAAGFGQDVITDFETGPGRDFIDVSGYSAWQSIAQQGSNVLISFSAGDSLLVRNVTVVDLTSGAIRFGAADIATSAIATVPVAVTPPPNPGPTSSNSTQSFLPVIGTDAAESLAGDIGPDDLRGGGGNDSLSGGTGNDLLDGGTGTDIAIFTGPRSAYTVSAPVSGEIRVVSEAEGDDRLVGIELLRFADGVYTWNGASGVLVAVSNASPAFSDPAPHVNGVAGTDVAFTTRASDAEGGTLTYIAGPAAHGVVTGGALGAFTYRSTAGFTGADSFTVTVDDGFGGTAQQTVWVQVVAVPASDTGVRLIAQNGSVGAIGGTGSIFGTNGFQDIAIMDQPTSIRLDGSFGRGGDIIRLSGNADAYSIALSGSFAILTDGDTTVAIPIGIVGLPIVFDDGVRTLVYDAAVASARIGAQGFSTTSAQIAAAPDGSILPVGANPDATARLVMRPGGDVAFEGDVNIFGTNGADRITLLGGDAVLDGSSGRGGDTLILTGRAQEYVAHSAGSSVILTSPDGKITIPIGTAGIMLDFDGDVRVLRFDLASGSIRIGDQAIASNSAQTAVPLTEQLVSLSLDQGSANAPVRIDLLAGKAYILNDDAGHAGHVRIDGMSGNDVIRVTGATASTYGFASGDADLDGSPDDLIISHGADTIAILNSVSPAAAITDLISAQAAIGWNFITFG
jgi:Ca2+-binding RTX toxin-like protein